MAPPAATGDVPASKTTSPAVFTSKGTMETSDWPRPPNFSNRYDERHYLKGRLALAFRIFAKLGFDEG